MYAGYFNTIDRRDDNMQHIPAGALRDPAPQCYAGNAGGSLGMHQYADKKESIGESAGESGISNYHRLRHEALQNAGLPLDAGGSLLEIVERCIDRAALYPLGLHRLARLLAIRVEGAMAKPVHENFELRIGDVLVVSEVSDTQQSGNIATQVDDPASGFPKLGEALAKAPSELARIDERLDIGLDGLSRILKRVRELANRVQGVTPGAITASILPPPQTEQPAVMTRLSDSADSLYLLVHELSVQVQRLERL